MSITNNLASIKTRIITAARRAGRNPKDIRLLVAGKYATADQLLQLIKAGHKLIGENRAQDLKRKYQAIGDQAEWHFIGHLQRNKVKAVLPYITTLHSLDNLRLAQELEKQLVKINKTLPVLVEVNTSREITKSGIYPEDTPQFIKSLSQFPHLKVTGLMTMAAQVTSPEDNRPHFKTLSQLAQTTGLSELSMGTSQDFEVAIAAGATIVRLGRIVFS
ncbi:MAG: YggS family pyridoxal phosphate-dependent enzyme [Candidatus Chisholmbacteria bacterium]|nr:YggS family pyridoxal phosphate-dependent enzyme [Candidatus Chisholmbacteria bacterium]